MPDASPDSDSMPKQPAVPAVDDAGKGTTEAREEGAPTETTSGNDEKYVFNEQTNYVPKRTIITVSLVTCRFISIVN